MPELRSLFGTRLRYLRRQADLTQEIFAERCGLSVDFISNVERGINAPSFENLEKFAQVLGVQVRDLFPFKDGEETDGD